MNIFSKNPERCCYILDLLIFSGANINDKNFDLWAPVHAAVRKNQELAIKAIIRLNNKIKKHNCSVGDKITEFNLNITGGTQKWSPLHLAAISGNMEMIKYLVEAGSCIF